MSEREERGREIEIRLLLEAIYLRFHHDFRDYSMASLKRRIEQARESLGCPTISALQERVLHDPPAFTSLLQYLTVPVSDLFRDPTFYRSMRKLVVPELLTYPSLRIWIAGCSTGEEVYSMAILLKEEGLLERTRIYATDVNPESLRKAEAGIFAIDRISTFTENHRASGGKGSLSEYYSAAYGAAVFDRSLRSRVVFSDHSLATDSVFAEVHLVSCRNVLIYFNRALQERAVGLFKDALVRRGFFGMGAKETLMLSKWTGSFTEIAAEDRWYQRT